jgi:membrane protein implicated in regulation of membrane protease activity
MMPSIIEYSIAPNPIGFKPYYPIPLHNPDAFFLVYCLIRVSEKGSIMQFEWWYWIIAGFCLIGLELLFPSFTIIWFGLGALAVGVMKALWPGLPAIAQLLLWPVASICFTLMWFKYLRPKGNKPSDSAARENVVGQAGIIIRGADGGCERWTVRFGSLLQGADEWCCYADEELQVGDRVRVTDIEGQVLKVARM